MKTTCPHCHTAFRVHEEQLDQHGGDVRCGRCGEIFNGYDYLEDQVGAARVLAAARVEPAPPAPEPEAPVAAAEMPGPMPQTEAAEPAAPAVPEGKSPVPDAEPPAGEEPVRIVAEAGGAEPDAQAEEPRGRRWPWVTACLFALMGLAAQAGILYRTGISQSLPGLRPVLEQLCTLAGCRIELPRHMEQLSIESSELQADPIQAETVVLLASLRNRSPHPQAYPLLELTLTDSQDRMVARRTFQPGEYHPQADLDAGFAAGSDLQVRLPLRLKDLQAVGYRLYLYYPQS